MIKSISAWAFAPERPLAEIFEMAARHGFAAVEVAIATEGELNPRTTAAQCRAIVSQAAAAGVQIAALASGAGWQLQLTDADAAARAEAAAFVAASLHVAHGLGLDAILLVPGTVDAPASGGAPYDAAYANALAELRKLAPLAEELGVTIGIENVWNRFLLSPLEMRDFIDAVGSPRVGAYFDTANVMPAGYAEQWIDILGPRIARVHFKDYQREVGTLAGFCDLLAGDVDYSAVMNALRRIGYNGFVTAEFFNCEADLPKIAAAMDAILAM